MGTTTILTTTTTKFLQVNRGRKKQQQKLEVPKGCLAVKVGEAAGGEQQRFVVPVIWFNHPLFRQLLKEAEDEYGFEQKGTITIPCNAKHFCNIISCIMIEHRHQPHILGCFRVWSG